MTFAEVFAVSSTCIRELRKPKTRSWELKGMSISWGLGLEFLLAEDALGSGQRHRHLSCVSHAMPPRLSDLFLPISAYPAQLRRYLYVEGVGVCVCVCVRACTYLCTYR